MIRRLFLALFLVEAALGLLLLTIVGCNQQKAQVAESNAQPLITMEKNECYGTCPVYVITIFEDGKADYKGEKHVGNIGHFQRQLPPEILAGLIRAFQEADFFSFQDEYVDEATDLPVTYLSFQYQGKLKKIKELINAPQQLLDLEKKVADIANSEGWQLAAN